MSVGYYESIDEFLGARESRYFGRGYINTAQTISGFALDDAEDGTRFSGSGVVQLPGLWSAKGERQQKPHLSSIDAIEFAISCLSRVFAQLHPGQAFSLERLEKMSVLAGREPVEENPDAIALRGHVRQDAMGAGTLEMQISNMKVRRTFSAEPGPAGLVLGQEKQPLEIRDLMLHRDTLKASAIVAPERQNKAESWSLSSCFAAALGLGLIPAFDASAVCSGFLYALSVATAFVRSGQYESVLVVAAEKFSSLIDPQDRNTACLFGDGAGAVIVARVPAGCPGEIRAVSLASDGRLEGLIKINAGGSRDPLGPEPASARPRADLFLGMQGQEVFNAAVTSTAASVNNILGTVGWSCSDLDWLVGHQANLRILNLLCKTLGLPAQKACVHLDAAGNTAAASIPLAMAAKCAQFQPGPRMVLTSCGAGATWGALAMIWPELPTVEPLHRDQHLELPKLAA